MMRSKWFVLLFAAMATASLWGCGSNGGSGGSSVAPTDAQPTVLGSDTCLSAMCHGNGVPVDPAVWALTAHADDAEAGCEGCHGGGGAHQGVGPLPYPSPTLTQCATCHDISTMHEGDDPATSYQTTPTAPTVEGYVMRSDEPTGCRDCHGDVHEIGSSANALNIEINQAWALSGHAGKIGAATPDTETVWGHYDWDASSRASCARCHTATGAMNFLNDPTAYVAANNDFSHLEGWTPTTSSQQNELLNCWGCHSDVVTGDLRNPGAITEAYDPAVTVTYPDVAESNVCMGCHLGRETGEVIKVDADADGVRSFINSHYLTAGATLFNESGYEYADGGDYDSFGYHKNIGVADAQGTGTNGPCVACHMTGTEPHTFEVSASSTVCVNCHTGLTDEVLEAGADEFAEALEELKTTLEGQGIYFYNAHPYFYTAPYVVGGTNTAFTDWQSVATAFDTANPAIAPVDWRDVMGAAFNYNLLEHDPGAFAHNNAYSLKLIADSIDFITDGVIDGDLSMAAELAGRGINVGSEGGYGTIHDGVAASEVNCSACHSEAPHYGGYESYATGGTWSGTAWSGTTTFPGKGQYVYEGTATYPVTCAECHGGGAANYDILAQYAESAHGNVMGDGWIHYNWKFTAATVDVVGSSDRSGCARCHTSTGYKAAMATDPDSPTPPFAAANGDAGDPAEVLSCGACHTDVSTGALNNPGAVQPKTTANPPVALVEKADPDDVATTPVATLPDAGASNVCYYCHAGGGNMFSNWSSTRVASHHAVAAGTLNSDVTRLGYEFVTADAAPATVYLSYDSSPHKSINLATTGPCVSCHMADQNHHFEPVDEATQTIPAQSVCNGCHGSMSYAVLEDEKAGYEAAGVLLAAYIGNTLTNYKNAVVTGTVTAHNDRAAWYNFKVFPAEEAGGFVHNPRYVKQLIFDSIDWLQDGVLNGTITTTALGAYPEALAWLGTTRP